MDFTWVNLVFPQIIFGNKFVLILGNRVAYNVSRLVYYSCFECLIIVVFFFSFVFVGSQVGESRNSLRGGSPRLPKF